MPGWREEGRLLPADAVRCAVIGFDLVREPISGWRVLEDNVRVPSGVGYAVGMRRVLNAVVPELAMGVPIRAPEETIDLLGRTLRACARGARPTTRWWPSFPTGRRTPPGTSTGPWPRGPASSWPNRRTSPSSGAGRWWTASRSTWPTCASSTSWPTWSTRRVGPSARACWRPPSAGEVALVNAPGNGVADDKSMYCHIPDVIDYYLGESPLLAQVPTYRCADPDELEIVLDRLEELVTKPVDGYGGGGVLIGRDATPGELEERRQALRADPARWVAQETMALSTLPTLEGGKLEARHVDLRTFVYLTGSGPGEAELAGLALDPGRAPAAA